MPDLMGPDGSLPAYWSSHESTSASEQGDVTPHGGRAMRSGAEDLSTFFSKPNLWMRTTRNIQTG